MLFVSSTYAGEVLEEALTYTLEEKFCYRTPLTPEALMATSEQTDRINTFGSALVTQVLKIPE